MGNEEERFGLAVDVLSAAMKGIVMYVALLITNFWMYQEGAGAFQPWLLLSIIPYMLVLAYIYCKYDDLQCALLHVAAAGIWAIFGIVVITNRWYYVFAVLLGLGISFVHKYILGDFDIRRYARRYKMQNYIKWGVAIVILSILLTSNSDGASGQYPIGPDVCGSYIVMAFGLYLVVIVLFRYMYLQYDYFRQRDTLDQYSLRQIRRMNGIITILVILLIGIAVTLINESVVQWLAKLAKVIFAMIVGPVLSGVGSEESPSVVNKTYVDVPQGARPDTDFRIPFTLSIDPNIILLIVGVLLVVWILKRIYALFAANYKTEYEQAEYIPVREKNEREYFGIDKEEKYSFENNNRGKIRKIYYKLLNSRIEKMDAESVKNSTPRELAFKYSKPQEREQIQGMTGLYEKARYSNEECTEEDVMEMKHLAGKS